MFADELLPTPKRLVEYLINGYSIFNGEKNFAEIDHENILLSNQFTIIFFSGTDEILVQECKGLSEEGVDIPATVDNIFAPKLTFIYNGIIGEKFEGCCLKKDNLLIIELK